MLELDCIEFLIYLAEKRRASYLSSAFLKSACAVVAGYRLIFSDL